MTSTKESLPEVRKAFEAWMDSKPHPIGKFWREGMYDDHTRNATWAAWQAAFTEGRRSGLDRAMEYLAGSTFAESERATVESCLSLLESLRHALAGGEGK